MTPIKEGYYWVKDGPEWIIAQYEYGYWFLMGVSRHVSEKDFDSFYPIPIELPDILKEEYAKDN